MTFVSDINDVLGTTQKDTRRAGQTNQILQSLDAVFDGCFAGLQGHQRPFHQDKQHFGKHPWGHGRAYWVAGMGKAPKTPRTPTSRFAKDTVAIDATDKGLATDDHTITTQVSPAVREVGAEFASIRRKENQ